MMITHEMNSDKKKVSFFNLEKTEIKIYSQRQHDATQHNTTSTHTT